MRELVSNIEQIRGQRPLLQSLNDVMQMSI
jgi:hypothetical protein